MEMAAAAIAALPDDLLTGVLGLLPARSVAASRGVCKAWRELIDERQLLVRIRSLLPHSVRGLFINYEDYYDSTHFLSRPTSSSSGRPRIDGKFDFIEARHQGSRTHVMDHCNGLVLYLENYGSVLQVCNPTTRWSAQLPRCPSGRNCGYSTLALGCRAFLVFDPFVSLEYKVLLWPHPDLIGRSGTKKPKDDPRYQMEWPPSPWKSWLEFSSSTGRWEEKVFVREGEATGTAGDLLHLNKVQYGRPEPHWQYGAYWQGALYIHCRGEYISRFSLLDGTYRVIKSPIQLADKENGVRTFLGRSEKGVYIAAIAPYGLAKLRVWTLVECVDQVEWEPKDESNLRLNTRTWWMQKKRLDKMKYWVLDIGYNGIKNQEVSVQQNSCWNSDDDNVIDNSDGEVEGRQNIKFLGFHPYKEVIFLCA